MSTAPIHALERATKLLKDPEKRGQLKRPALVQSTCCRQPGDEYQVIAHVYEVPGIGIVIGRHPLAKVYSPRVVPTGLPRNTIAAIYNHYFEFPEEVIVLDEIADDDRLLIRCSTCEGTHLLPVAEVRRTVAEWHRQPSKASRRLLVPKPTTATR